MSTECPVCGGTLEIRDKYIPVKNASWFEEDVTTPVMVLRCTKCRYEEPYP